jgi:hypothetical protein
MLAWSAQLSGGLLQKLAMRLVRAGKLDERDVDATVTATQQRLAVHYGRLRSRG